MNDSPESPDDKASRNNGEAVNAEQHAEHLRRNPIDILIYKRRSGYVGKAASVNETDSQRIADKRPILQQAPHRFERRTD